MCIQGGWETDETVEAAAKRETIEEAGVRGVLEVGTLEPLSHAISLFSCCTPVVFPSRQLWDSGPLTPHLVPAGADARGVQLLECEGVASGALQQAARHGAHVRDARGGGAAEVARGRPAHPPLGGHRAHACLRVSPPTGTRQ